MPQQVQAEITDTSNQGTVELFSDAIELELIQQPQDPTDLSIEYTLRIKSLVDTQRLRLQWQIVKGFIVPANKVSLTDAIDITKGQEIYVHKQFKPVQVGNEELRVRAIVFFGSDPVSDYYSFTSTKFFVNSDLLIAPNRQEFVNARACMHFLGIIKVVMVVGIIITGITVVYWRFRVWLDSD